MSRLRPFVIAAVISLLATPVAAQQDSAPAHPQVTREMLRTALQLWGLEYTDAELDLLLEERGTFGNDFSGQGDRRNSYDAIRALEIDNGIPPALFFHPLPPLEPVPDLPPRFSPPPAGVTRPDRLEDVAFWPVVHLAELVRTGQVTSVELTEMYLERLRWADARLYAVVTFLDSLALAQARRADRELAAGQYRGPLHGIPYGIKDIFAVPGHPTTWGAEPFRDQVRDETAAVVQRLEAAGAVLVAKLTTGALAMGDVWYGERTRNPWNPEQGASGSSAGPGSAVAAGLVGFAIGTETLGSIVSPSTRNGVTGLRPSFGRVSRAGVMALSWSMDKAGPMCRYAEDCAMVFDAIRGWDPADPATMDQPFPYDGQADVTRLRVGYVESAFEGDRDGLERDRAVLAVLRELGVELIPIALPDLPARELIFLLSAEAAAAFDALTRSDRDSLLVRQDAGAWPNTFRSARFIPAVEYIQANRARRMLQGAMRQALAGLDAYVSPSFAGGNLWITNLTGEPCVAVPNGFNDEGAPTSITFCAPMYGEAAALALAKAYQDATEWDERHPEDFRR